MKNKKIFFMLFFLLFISGVICYLNFSYSKSDSNEYIELNLPSSNNAYFNNLDFSKTQDFADPYVLIDKDTYYVYTTGCSGIRIYKTQDLKKFSLYTSKALADTSDYTCFWAPEVYYHNSKYYMFYTGIRQVPETNTDDRMILVAESDSPTGPFVNSTIVNSQVPVPIDASVFFDDDGKIYLYTKRELNESGSFNGIGTSLFVEELNDDMRTVKEDVSPVNVLTLDPAYSNNSQNTSDYWERYLIEGPFVIKRNNKYYLMYSTGSYKNYTYAVGYAVGNSPKEKFTKKTVNLASPLLYGSIPVNGIYDNNNYLYGVGHNSILKISNDEMYMAYHSVIFENNVFKRRKINFDYIGFDENSNLYVNGPSLTNQPLPSGINGFYRIDADDYEILSNDIVKNELKDYINYNVENSANNIGKSPLTTCKTVTSNSIQINLLKERNVTDIWLFGTHSGFDNTIANVIINDKYIINNINMGLSSTYKLQLPEIEESISKIVINFSNNITLSEINLYRDSNVSVKFMNQDQVMSTKTCSNNNLSGKCNIELIDNDESNFKGWSQDLSCNNIIKANEQITLTGNKVYYSCYFSIDNTLKSITLDSSIVDDFESSKTLYEKKYDYSKSSVTIDVEKNDSKATVTGTGPKSLNVGKNEFSIIVTSESGVQKEYKIVIIREELKKIASDINTLKSITLDSSKIVDFESSKTLYEKIYGFSKSSIKIDVEKTDNKSTVTGIGQKSLNVGKNEFSIIVTSESGITKEYKIIIIREDLIEPGSNINTLKSIIIDDVSLNSFSENIMTYDYETNNNNIKIEALKNDSKSVVSGVGTYWLNNGLNTFKILVTSESGITNTYYLNVVKKEIKSTGSSINTLKTLSIDKANINFNSNILIYNVNVDSNIDKVNITSTLSDSKSKYISGYGNRNVNLKYGLNTILVKVQAENESIKTYTINITRKDNRSNINTIQNLTIEDVKVDFNPNILEYNLEVDSSKSVLIINSNLTDEKSTYVKDYGNRKVELKNGLNTFLIKVQAENGSIKTYTLNIFKTIDDDELLITKLKIVNYDIEFQSEKYQYSLSINKEKNLDIMVELSRKDASYEILNNENLENGSIIVIKTFLNDNSQSKEYKINIIKDEILEEAIDNKDIENNDNNSNYVIPIIVLGVGVVALTITLVVKKIKV